MSFPAALQRISKRNFFIITCSIWLPDYFGRCLQAVESYPVCRGSDCLEGGLTIFIKRKNEECRPINKAGKKSLAE